MYVYFIRAVFSFSIGGQKKAGLVQWKIGRTHDLERRKKALQTACPVPLELFASLVCGSVMRAIEVERTLHEFFAGDRLEGEWFLLNIKQAAALKRLERNWETNTDPVYFLNREVERPLNEAEKKLSFPATRGVVPLEALHQIRAQYRALQTQFLQLRAENVRLRKCLPSASLEDSLGMCILQHDRWLVPS